MVGVGLDVELGADFGESGVAVVAEAEEGEDVVLGGVEGDFEVDDGDVLAGGVEDEASGEAGAESAEDVFHGIGGVIGCGGGGGFFDDESVVAYEGVEAEAAEPLDARALPGMTGFGLLGDFVEGGLEVWEVDAV